MKYESAAVAPLTVTAIINYNIKKEHCHGQLTMFRKLCCLFPRLPPEKRRQGSDVIPVAW